MTAPKSFSDLPSWQDIEQSEGFSALDQQKKNEAYDLWSSDYTRLAIENPDELNPGDWEFFKKANARKKAELSGSATPLDLDDAEDAPLDLQPKVSSLVGLANQFEELDKKYQVGQTTPEEWEAHDALKKVFTPEKKELAEKIKAIQTSSDDESMIHDGEFIASPSLLLKKKEYAEAIRNSTLTDEQKADALFQGRMLRDRVGSSLREQIRQVDEGMADAWLGGLNSFKEFEEIEKQRDPDLSDADIMEAWQRKTGMFSNMEAQFKLGLRGGFADLISTYYGLKQLTGLGDQETAMRMGQAALEAGQKLGAAGEAIGGATALKTLTQVGVGMLPQVISGGTAGMVTAAGRFALAGAGRIAATAGLRRAAVASVATRLGTEASKKLAAKAAARAATSTLAQTMILSGVQSAGASFQSTYDDYLKEEVDMLPTALKEDPQALALAKERARKSARGRSLVSGAVTGIVTGAFGLTGLESFGKAAKDVIARPGWQEAIKAGLGSYLIRTAGKEFSSEFSEEAIDNAANDLIDKIALGGDKPIGDIIKESLEAGIVGGVFGGGIGTAKALSDVYEARKQAKTNPNIRQQLEAAERAANAGLPAVSAVVREKAEAQVESLTQQQLDEKAAQQTAEAEKALQQPPATEAPVSEASQVQPAYRPATEVARAVEDQLNGLPADDPQREVLQQRLEGLRMAISANPDAMVPMLEPEQAATAEGAADPFAPPGEASTSVPDWVKESAAAAAAQVPAEIQQRVKELAADRKTARETATETGLDVDTVRNLRIALGIPRWTTATTKGGAPVESPEFTAWRKKFLSAPSVEAPSQPGSAPQPPVAKTAEERDIQSAEYTLKLATEWTNKNGAAFGVSEPAYIAFANDEGTDIHPPRMPQVLAEKARLEKIGYTFDLANRKPAKGGTHTGVIIPIIPLPPATVATPTPPVASLPRGQKKEAQPAAASKSVFDRPGPGFGDKRTVRELAEQGGPGRDPLLVPKLPKFSIGDGAQVTTNTGEKVTLNDDPRWDEGLNQWMYPTTVGTYQERNLASVDKEAPMSGKALLGIPRGKPISGAVMTFTRGDGPPTFTAAPPPTETVPAEAPAKAKAKRVRRTKAEAQPEPPKPSDTETKKPQASSVPPVEREPAVESPAGQAQEGTTPRIGKGQKAEARVVTKLRKAAVKEVAAKPAPVKAAAEKVAKATTPVTKALAAKVGFAPAGSPAQIADTYYPALEDLMFNDEMRVPNTAQINALLKANTGRGLPNGDPALTDLLVRLQTAWSAKYPSEKGVPDAFLVGAHKGSVRLALEEKSSKDKSTNEVNGVFPVKIVRGKKVGFFTNDPTLTARQFSAGLAPKIPASIIKSRKVHSNIKFDAEGNVTSVIHPKYDVEIKSLGQLQQVYGESPQKARKAEIRVGNIDKKLADAANKLGVSPDIVMDRLGELIASAENTRAIAIQNGNTQVLAIAKANIAKYTEMLGYLQSATQPDMPSASFVGNLLADYPDPAPNEESLLSKYLLLDDKNQTTKLETMIRNTLSNKTLRAKGVAVEQEVLTGVINTALREIRAASSRNDGAEVDPAKLRSIRFIVEDMVKETERKQLNHRSISTVSRDELNAEGAALIDPSDEAPNPAETMMVREEEELTNAPVSPELAAELKEGMLKLFPNQKISGPDSIAAQTQRLVQNPAQARRAAEFLKAKIPFSVGLDGELVFSYGKKLTGEELASLVKLMDKINIPATGLPKGEKTLLERLDKNPNVGRFFLEASLYLREVLLGVKMTDGSPMYTEAAINKKNFLELTRLAGTETTNRALDAARSNLDKYIDLPDVSLPRAMAVVTYALGGKRARVARTDRGTVRLVFDPRDPGYSSSAMLDKSRSEWASYDRQTRVLMTYQTEEEAKVHREVMVESLRGFVGTARTKMAALEERVKKAEEQLAYLKETIPSLGEVGPPTQAAITKRTAEISRIERNRDGMVAEFSSLDDSVQQAEATLADIVAPPVSALPDSPEKAAIKEAFVKKLQRMSQVFKNQVERARAAGATESTRLARSVAISREVTATAPGSAWPRTIHETSLYDAGIKSGESAASLRSALSRLANTVDKNRPPAIQHLAKMIVDNQALMEGIEGVDVIHDPMLRMDAVVSEGILVINTASMPGTVMTEQEAKHLAVEAALRALIHNAAANLTAPDAVLTDSQRQALDSLEQLRQEAIEVERKTRPDGLQSRFAPHLKDVASFVSGVMTSPEFANMLQGYRTSVKTPGLKSVWGRFWKALANLLTGRDTLFGSALHASLMESGRLFALNPPPGPSVMDNMVAAMSDPGIAFPSSRTSQVAELVHIERVEEAMDTADSSEAITTAQDRLLGFGTGDTETEQANEGVLPDNMALGAPGKVAKKKKPARVAKAAPATPTPEAPATPTPTARAKKKAPSKKTPWQFFNSIKGATAVVQRAQQSVEGAEDVEMPTDEELNTAREQLCQKIQTLRNSSYSDKKSRIRALEKLVSQIDLHLSESPTPPLDTDSESVVAVAGETPEVLPPADEETEVEDALPETQTEEQAEEEAAESDEDPEQHQEAEPETAPINGAELSRQVSESTGYSVTFVVSAAPDSATSEPVFVTHDRNDRTIYVRNQQVENLIKQGMDAGMSREAAQKYAFEKVLEDAETMAIVHKFSDGELLRTYEEMTVKERQEIIKKVYGLKPGMPGYAEASGRSKNLSLEQMTQQRAAIAIHYLRRLRQLATTGFTTEDVVAMRNKPQSAVARAVAYLRASARQFFTRWNTYGNVYAVRAILNAEDFLTQLGESPVAGSSMLTDPGKIPAAEVVPTLARVLGKTSAEVEEDIEEGLRIRKLLLNDKDFGDENMTRPMEADEMTAFLDELGLKDGDPASVAEALRRISEMDGVDPVVQNVAKYLSEHADIANLAAFSTTMKGISVRSRNGQFVEPAGLYYSTQHALVINTNAEYPISKNSFIETFLHECTHATTSIAIQKYTNYKKSGSVGDAPLAPDTMKAVAELETILNGVRDFAKKNGDTQYDYRLSDVEEFVAGVLTDTRFTSWLSSVPNSAVAGVGSDSNTSLIKRILMRIYRIAWPDLDTNVTVMKSLDRIFNIAARPQVVITPVSPSKEVLGVFTPEQFAAAPERLRERQASSEVLNVNYDAFIEKASSAISEASRDASANLPAVGTGVLAPSMTVVSEIDADYTVALQGDSGNDNLTEQLRAASKADRQKVLNDWVARNPQSAEMLQRTVNEAARKAGYTRKGVRFGYYVDGVPLPPSRNEELNFGPGYYVAEDATLDTTTDAAVSVSPKVNKVALERLGLDPNRVEFRRDAVFVKAAKPFRSEYGTNADPETVAFIEAQLAYDSAVQEANRKLGLPFESTSYGKTVADLIAQGRIPFDSRQGQTGRVGMSSELVVQDPSQIKSSAPVTYDDAGNVISLSQRFNPKSPDIRANLPAVGNKQARRFVSDGDRQAMLERMRPTRALLNSIPGLAPSVQAMLAGAEYAGSVNSDDLSVVEARIGPALRSAVGPAEYQELAGRLADYNLTPVQSQIALAVIVKGLNDRLVSLSSMGVKSSARFAVERDFARTAEILSRRLQDIRSNNAQELQIGNLIRNILNPAYAARTYRTSMVDKAREMLEGSPETAAAVETVKGIATAAADEAAATAVRRSTLPRRVAEAGGRAAGADPEMVQTMFDFMEELSSLQVRGTIQTSGLPIPADMANWVADRMVQMMKGRLTKVGSDERTFLEEYSDEVRRQVAARINAVLKEGADAGESAPSLVDRLITSLEFAPMVESALNQSREAILARLVPGPDATPEQIAAYDDARTRLAGLTYDIVPLDTAIKVVRKSFNMRQQVLLELTDQHTSLEALTAMIAESADLSETQAAALAKSFRTAYEAEARRVTEKMLKDYAQRIKDAKIRGPVEKLTKSEKFLQLARLGGLRDEEVYDAMAKEFGLPSYDPEVAARLDAEAVRISEMPQGSVQRLDATRELNASVVRELFNQLLSAQGVSALRKNPEMFWKYLRDIPISMWKSGVLSGFGTQQVNFAMGTIQSVMDLSFNSVAYAVKAKDPSLAAGNFLTLLRSIGWMFDPATRKETWLEMKRAAMTGRTRFASEQSENMLVLEQDIPPPDIPVVKQLMSGTKNFFKLLGRLISIVDATVSVPAYVARQRMALAYAMSMQGIQGKHAADLMRASFSPDETTMREINAIVESEKAHFSSSPRPDLAMQARRMQLLEQRRAELYDKITDGMSDIDRESFIEASRESASFANLSGKPVGIMGAIFDGCFGQLERATGGATSILFSFVKAMANMFDFSAAMSFPLGAISFARAFNASPSALMDQNNKYRRKRVERGSVEFYKLITQGFAALAIQSTVAALYVAGLEDEKEDREPYFMVYGEGPADPELAAQLRYRQPRWKPYTLKVGSLYLNWKDLPGFNIMMSGLAAVTDGMMNSKTKDPSKLRSERETVKYAIGLVRSVIAKNSMQGIMDAAEILSDNTIAKASADVKAVKMATNFVSGVTNPRLIRDIADIGRGIAGGGEFALPQVSNYSQALQTLVPGHTVTTDTDAMVNMVGRPITNFWFAPLTKRLLPMTADDGYDPILTPLVSAGLEVSPVKSSAKIATLKSDSDEIDPAGGTLGSFSPEVQVKASKLFGDYLDRTMTQKYIEDVTRRGRLGGESLKAAQEEIDRLCTDARKYATDMIESEVLQRKIKPHWQE